LSLRWEIVDTAALKRAIARLGHPPRKPRFWERGRDRFGMKSTGGFGIGFLINAVRPATQWEREHSSAWVIVATSVEAPRTERAWISPAAREADAIHDLDDLAAQIKLGEEPDPPVATG
jgi:hypothetical protein